MRLHQLSPSHSPGRCLLVAAAAAAAQGSDVRWTTDAELNTPLHLLARSRGPEALATDQLRDQAVAAVLGTLLFYGADAGARNFQGRTPLHMSAEVTPCPPRRLRSPALLLSFQRKLLQDQLNFLWIEHKFLLYFQGHVPLI